MSENEKCRMFGECVPDQLLLVEKEEISNADYEIENEKLCAFIKENLIGHETSFKGPFGERNVLYCDYTASGRALKCIEDYIEHEVLPLYGNSHSSVSVTAEQSTLFLHEARQIIGDSSHASEHDVVLFCGNGTTCAVHVLIHALNLNKAPIVFVGPFEHHSNLLPWREIGAKIVRIVETEYGCVDLEYLKEKLKTEKEQNPDLPLIGCFSAASNISGVLTNVHTVTSLLHSFGAFAFWDYAACASYLPINMNPVGSPTSWKDAVFYSGHKLIGGVSSPGILIAKKSLFRSPVPLMPGGGTVFFVQRDCHSYLKEIEYREEGGTPDIIGAIRLGLAIKLKDSIGTDFIEKRDKMIISYVNGRLSKVENLLILGPTNTDRLPIYSFVIKHNQSGLFLHHNFVCALLDNLFGIQSRAGCACAGPYAQDLLGMDHLTADRFEKVLKEDVRLDREHLRRKAEYSDYEMLRPGFTRLNFPYFLGKKDVDFIIDSLEFVAKHGWKFLPQYRLNPESGEWHHINQPVFKDRKWLGHVTFASNGMQYKVQERMRNGPMKFDQSLENAQTLMEKCLEVSRRIQVPDGSQLFSGEANKLRWFLLSDEAKTLLLDGIINEFPVSSLPFHPKIYPKETSVSDFTFNGFLSEENEVIIEDTYDDEHDDVIPTCSLNGSDTVAQREDWNKRKVVIAKKENEIDRNSVIFKWHVPPSKLFKLVNEAIEEYGMIKEGDRILVCLSGGKDSLSLLHTMRQYQFYAKNKLNIIFELGAITVDPGSSAYDPSPLIEYMTGLNITYLYEQQRILDQAKSLAECESICSFCSRMKRGRLYSAARKHGWNVLAFGQHLDDLVESFLMSTFQNGTLRTMKAQYTVKQGDIRVIRPLVYVREKQLRDFAEGRKLPIIPENCPACFEAPKERHRIKQMLASQEMLFPKLFHNLRSAIQPLMAVSAVNTQLANIEAVNNIVSKIKSAHSDLLEEEE